MASSASADAIIVTQAMNASTIVEIFVEESSIRVEAEIGGSDLQGFRNLLPDSVFERLGNAPEPLSARLPRFFAEDLVIRPEGGKPMPARVLELEPRPKVKRDLITGEPLPPEEGETETVVFGVFEYLFDRRPDALTISAPRSESGAPGATIGFVLYHQGLPVTDFRYLGHEATVDLEWSDPWYSKFRNRNLRRQYDAPMNAFLYVEPYEVRAEVILRPIDVEQWIDVGLEGVREIPVEAQFELKQRIAEFVGEHLNLKVDGEPVEPELDRVNFLRRTLRTSTVIDPPEPLDAFSATLGVIYVWPTEGLPQEASLTWDLFSPRIQKVPAAATDEAGPLRFFLAPDDNVLWWKNFLKNPTLPTLVDVEPPPSLAARAAWWLAGLSGGAFLLVGALQLRSAFGKDSPRRRGWAVAAGLLVVAALSLALALPARMTDERAGELVGALLHNIYRAFDFRGEEAIYDVLDRSVGGDLLTETYLETRRSLELASQGGARAKVKEIELLEVEPRRRRGEPGFVARCLWNVSGAVGHWGHVHTRKNQYEAELTIEPVDGTWKVTGMEVLQEERI
jgi:hypothetical protein